MWIFTVNFRTNKKIEQRNKWQEEIMKMWNGNKQWKSMWLSGVCVCVCGISNSIVFASKTYRNDNNALAPRINWDLHEKHLFSFKKVSVKKMVKMPQGDLSILFSIGKALNSLGVRKNDKRLKIHFVQNPIRSMSVISQEKRDLVSFVSLLFTFFAFGLERN